MKRSVKRTKPLRPYISVVIPAYNAGPTLPRLLASLSKSTYKDFEVIIGDDASEVPLSSLYEKHNGRFKVPVLYIRLTRNQGPAAARNVAASKANGKVLVFLDSDVEVYPDTLRRIADKFLKDPDLTAVTGVWDKEQRTNRFFPNYKALRDWSYWINERDRDGYYYLFSTRIAALRRDVFRRLGGFNVSFRQMEDVEITYRIARRYAIIFAPDVRVHHEFEGFNRIAKKYFWRSFYFSKLWIVRRKFDPVATTMWETLAAVSGVGSMVAFGTGMVAYFIYPVSIIRSVTLAITTALLGIHLLFVRKFLVFVYKEKGLGFTLQAFFMGLILYFVILSGALYYTLHQRLRS